MLVSRGDFKSVLWSGTPATLWPTAPALVNGHWPVYGVLYAEHLWVYTVVTKRASLLANLPLKVYRRGEQGREEARDHPLATLLRDPWPGRSPVELWTWVSTTFDVYGEAFLWKVRDRGGRPVALAPLHPSNMHRRDDVAGWRFDNGSTRMELSDDDVVFFRRYSPLSAVRGLSPLEPLRRTLENEDAARRATSAFWRNGARPAVALRHPANLTQPAQARLKAQWENIAAGVDRTGATVLLEEGMEAQVLSLSAEEAQYVETRKLNREEVCAAYDVAPPAVHILDNATFSNITEQFRSVYRDTIGPLAHLFESVIEAQLRRPDFGDEVYAEFLMDEVLRGSFEARLDAYKQADFMTVAEKRQKENLPFIEGTDIILVNTASQPLEALTAAAEALPEELPDNVIPLPVARAVAGRLAWQKSLDEVDPDALTVGLNGSTETVLAAFDKAKADGITVAGFRERINAMAKE